MVVRRVVEPKLLAAVYDSLQRRGTELSELTPEALLVELCQILDSWHIVEDAGNNASTSGLVELLQETIGGHDGEAYCMSTQQSITGLAEALLQKRSNLPASEACVDTFKQAERAKVCVLPAMHAGILPGDIAIWQHLSTEKGHTGRVVAVQPDGGFTSFEGNTSGGAGINRDGAGCYMKQRDRKTKGEMFLLGFIREAFA